MIYGANGYTGELAAREAAGRGLKPILAGRNAEAVGALASELGLPHRVFGLEAPQLEGVSTVLHCAATKSGAASPALAIENEVSGNAANSPCM